MGIFKDMHELRVVGSVYDCRELRRMLSEAIARDYVEQIPVMKPHRYAPQRDLVSGQGNWADIYSLYPFDERPGSWTEVDLRDLMEPDKKVQ